MQSILFDSSDSLLRIVVSVPLLYFAVVAFIRISGKRTTSQMNSFDWIVTVAMGSIVASGIILKDTHIVEVLLSIALLIVLQYLIAKGVLKSTRLAVLVKSQPVLLFYDGELLPDAMKQERISEREIMAAIRGTGAGTKSAVMAVTLETDATLSVLLQEAATGTDMSAYQDVEGWPASSEAS